MFSKPVVTLNCFEVKRKGKEAGYGQFDKKTVVAFVNQPISLDGCP